MNEAHELILSLPVRQLVAVMRALKGGPLGYDFSKRSKEELQTDALSIFAGVVTTYDLSVDQACNTIKAILVDGKLDEASRAVVASSGKTVDGLTEGCIVDDGAGWSLEFDEADISDGERHHDPFAPQVEETLPPDGDTSDYDSHNPVQGHGKEGEKDAKSGEDGQQGETKRQAPDLSTPQGKLVQAMQAIMEDMLPKDKPPTPEQIEKMIQKEIKSHAVVYRVEITQPDMPKIEDDAKPRHAVFKEALQAVSRGLNVLLVGPAGCGKTVMAEQVATALGLSFRCTGAVGSEYKLLGFMSAQGSLVRTSYRESYEHGGLFLWDELDASSAQALMSFNSGLANGYQDFPDTIVPRHKDFRVIASANTYGNGADRMYVGRNQLDAASLDRFYLIPMDYDEELELTLFGDEEWVKYVHSARRALRSFGGAIRHVISMRAIDQGLRMRKSGIPRKDVERAVLWKHLDAADINKIKSKMAA